MAAIGRRRGYAGIQNCAFAISRSNWLAAAFADVRYEIANLNKADAQIKTNTGLPTLRIAN